MKFLKAIGNFFVRIWRWIKETAWVQPLLIVGAIFALIFSIPNFTSWISSFGFGTANAYYSSFQVSLEGEVADSTDKSSADSLTSIVEKGSNFDDAPTYAEATYDSSKGDKFFLLYVSSSCTECDSAKPGFDVLQNNWKTDFIPSDSRDFKMYTIFSDEDSSTDDDDPNNYTAFQRYLMNFDEFFSNAGGRLGDSTPYRYNAGLDSSTDYTYFQDADIDNFKTPTILLVDFSEEAYKLGRMGVSEVLFGVSGDADYSKAKLLLQMWNHTDKDIQNPFSDSYVKS